MNSRGWLTKEGALRIVGRSNTQILIQYEIDVEYVYQIAIVPVSPTFYLIIDVYFPEYAKVVKLGDTWKMTEFTDSISDAILSSPEYNLSYPYTLEKIGSFYEDNFELMIDMINSP